MSPLAARHPTAPPELFNTHRINQITRCGPAAGPDATRQPAFLARRSRRVIPARFFIPSADEKKIRVSGASRSLAQSHKAAASFFWLPPPGNLETCGETMSAAAQLRRRDGALLPPCGSDSAAVGMLFRFSHTFTGVGFLHTVFHTRTYSRGAAASLKRAAAS
jgi:hypothetical protein